MRADGRRGAVAVLGILVILGALRIVRGREPVRTGEMPGGVWVSFEGDVERPGLVRLPRPEPLASAARRVGARCGRQALTVLRGGERVRMDGCTARIGKLPGRVRLVLGLPLDPNEDSAEDLARLPGVGPRLAAAIVGGRPYRAVSEMERVKGIGPLTLRRLAPWLEVEVERAAQRQGQVHGERLERR